MSGYYIMSVSRLYISWNYISLDKTNLPILKQLFFKVKKQTK